MLEYHLAHPDLRRGYVLQLLDLSSGASDPVCQTQHRVDSFDQLLPVWLSKKTYLVFHKRTYMTDNVQRTLDDNFVKTCFIA